MLLQPVFSSTHTHTKKEREIERSSSVFNGANLKKRPERGEERGGDGWSEPMDRLTIRSGSTLPLTTTTPTLHIHLKKKKRKKRKTNHTERLVGRTEPGVKGERKGLFCVPSVNLVLKDTQTHVHKATHKHTLTHTYARAHTLVSARRWR